MTRKAGLFEVLEKMNTDHVGSVHAYFSDNVENVNAGKQGWGSVKIAIITGDAQEIIAGMVGHDVTKSVMLFVVDRSVMDSVKEEIEAEASE